MTTGTPVGPPQWAIEALEGMAGRWRATTVWHEPEFHVGKVNVTTRELHAADVVLADAAALREQLAEAERLLRRAENLGHDYRVALDEARALALANGEARERAEAEAAKLRVDMEEMVEAAGRHTALDAKLERLADGLTENGRAIDAAVVARAERAEAEGDELRGLLAGVTGTCRCSKCEAVRAWLLAHPVAIPEGTPGEGTPWVRLD